MQRVEPPELSSEFVLAVGGAPAFERMREGVEMVVRDVEGGDSMRDVEGGEEEEEEDDVPKVAANRPGELRQLLESMAVQRLSLLAPSTSGSEGDRSPRADGEDEEEDLCTVCLETMGPDSRATRLPCQHKFHHECALDWFSTRLDQLLPGRCPSCNALVVSPKAPEPQLPAPPAKISRAFYGWILCLIVGATLVMAAIVALSSNENSSWALPKRESNGTRCSWSGNCVKIDPPANATAAVPADGQPP
jgi:hypothetical protein